MSDYFKSDDRYIYLKKPYAEFYIPNYYFEGVGGFATDLGQTIRTLGVFDIGFFKEGKLEEWKVMNIPTWIELFVYDSENRSVELPKMAGSTPCRVLKYFEGSRLMDSVTVEDSTNAETYLSFVLSGKVPPSVPYNKSLELWQKNQALNDADLKVHSVIEELILSVSYRDKNNLGQKFAKVIGKDPSTSQYDYTMASIRQICQYASTFTALTFEDIDSMITTSLNRTRTKAPEAHSPIEKIIKM